MRTWIITGASSGFDKVIAETALEQGNQVVGTARKSDKLAELGARYPNAFMAASLESTSEESRKALVAATLERFGRIDVLVNNAGVGHLGAVEDRDWTDIRQAFEVNYFGPVGLIRKVLPIMRKQQGGLIVNVSSMGVHLNTAAGNAFYCSSKAALEMTSEILRNECGDYGVDVMVVEPGSFATGFRAAIVRAEQDEAKAYNASAEAFKHNAGMSVFGPQGDPTDAGRAIVAAASAPVPPKTLVLGEGMVEAAISAYEGRIENVRQGARMG